MQIMQGTNEVFKKKMLHNTGDSSWCSLILVHSSIVRIYFNTSNRQYNVILFSTVWCYLTHVVPFSAFSDHQYNVVLLNTSCVNWCCLTLVLTLRALVSSVVSHWKHYAALFHTGSAAWMSDTSGTNWYCTSSTIWCHATKAVLFDVNTSSTLQFDTVSKQQYRCTRFHACSAIFPSHNTSGTVSCKLHSLVVPHCFLCHQYYHFRFFIIGSAVLFCLPLVMPF